jgi:hypothetical protein
LHLHVHLALEEKPCEAQDLALKLSLQKNRAKKVNKFNISMTRVSHHLFEMMMVLHIKTLLVIQIKQQLAMQLFVVFCIRATQRGK